MALKKLKPTTPGQRHKIISEFDDITTNKPHKGLITSMKKSGGRNNQGRMTIRYRGGGHKRRYRLIDWLREKDGMAAKVLTVEYDPNRSSRISLVEYEDGEKRYIITPQGLEVGQTIMSGPTAGPEVGNTLRLKNIPLGTIIHNIELVPGKGGQLARSAGSFAQLNAREGKYATIKLPSGEVRMILVECKATIGAVGNSEHNLQRSGKAGRSRWLGRRPRVRGVAMNPVDHPMGGGEGRSSGGHPRSRNGVPAKGFRTRSKKKASNRLIVERRKK
jgi:large subunit ribosomal protein L2